MTQDHVDKLRAADHAVFEARCVVGNKRAHYVPETQIVAEVAALAAAEAALAAVHAEIEAHDQEIARLSAETRATLLLRFARESVLDPASPTYVPGGRPLATEAQRLTPSMVEVLEKALRDGYFCQELTPAYSSGMKRLMAVGLVAMERTALGSFLRPTAVGALSLRLYQGSKLPPKVCRAGRKRCPPVWKCRHCGRMVCEHFCGSKVRNGDELVASCGNCGHERTVNAWKSSREMGPR